MTMMDQIIQRVRELDALWAGAADKRAQFFENNGISELATCAPVLADAYEAQARKLAEVEAENVQLRDQLRRLADSH